jgi:hypothetical protein
VIRRLNPFKAGEAGRLSGTSDPPAQRPGLKE